MRGARRTEHVRRSAARAGQRRRWAFFSSLSGPPDRPGANPPLTAGGRQGRIAHQDFRVFREERGKVAPRASISRAPAIRFQETLGGFHEAALPRQGQAEVLVGVVSFGIERDGRPGVDLGVRVAPEEVQVVALRIME
jgi:hypothetical protein